MHELAFSHPLITKLPPITQKQITLFLQEINRWNEKINLISRKDTENIVQNHLLPSLSFTKLFHLNPHTKVLDIGTGGGFPGIILAICHPNTPFTLIDTIGKKIKVLESIKDELDLKNITLIHGRVENLSQTFDYVIGRAVTNLPTFLNWAKPRLKKNGQIFYLKGGPIEPEVHSIPHAQHALNDLLDTDQYADKYIIHFEQKNLHQLKTPITPSK
jgi:16S rRNA (guanine527-N7)-methyltransferase